MKKTVWLALILLLTCMFAFSACDREDTPQTSTDTTSGTTDNTTESKTDAHVHAFGEWLTVKEATCTVKGEQERSCSCGEKETNTIDTTGHTEVTDVAVPATCKSTGLTEGSHCSVCDKTLVEQTVLPISDIHTPITDVAVPATCKSTGLTEGSHCSVCDKTLVEQTVLPISDIHTPITDVAVPATCKSTGLTEGSHCSVCDKTLVEQTVLPISDIHTPVTDVAVPATCKSTGLTEGRHCKICNEILVAQNTLPMTDHIFTDNKCGTCTTYIPSNGLNLEYDSANNRYLVLGIGTCTDKRVVIPSEVDGVPVARIERNAFKDTSSFYEIVIPNSIVTIMPDAFKNSSVESVILPDSLDVIPNNCFNNCANLSSITFPQSLYSIGEYAFYNCKKLPSTLVFPERLQYIKAYAFTNCTSIKKMIFSDRLIKISHDAFTNIKFEQIKYAGTSYQWKGIVETGWCSNYQNYLLVCLNGSF